MKNFYKKFNYAIYQLKNIFMCKIFKTKMNSKSKDNKNNIKNNNNLFRKLFKLEILNYLNFYYKIIKIFKFKYNKIAKYNIIK